MSWQNNAIMYWSTDQTTWNMISDHNRDTLQISVDRIENSNRMANGTLRRYTVAKKREFSTTWSNIPGKRNATYNGKTALTTVDGGWAGEDILAFHNSTDGAFYMKLRKGADDAKAITDGTLEIVQVMITSFSHDIVKRGAVDLWNIDITLEEV
jgi:hypothetical protein